MRSPHPVTPSNSRLQPEPLEQLARGAIPGFDRSVEKALVFDRRVLAREVDPTLGRRSQGAEARSLSDAVVGMPRRADSEWVANSRRGATGRLSSREEGNPAEHEHADRPARSISLRGGARIPQLGFGVFQVPLGETAEAVANVLDVGYRHIDTAAAYRNEAGVGQAIRASGLDRGEVFLTTKCFNDDHGYDEARRAFETSLGRLEMDYVDLYLIHWPVPAHDRYVDTWRAFVDLQAEGLIRAIGSPTSSPSICIG